MDLSAQFLNTTQYKLSNLNLLFCKKKKVTIDELIDKLEGPDFVTGGEVFEFSNMRGFYENGGEYTMRVRGKTRIEGDSVIIYEIPTTLAGGIISYSNDLQDKIADGSLTLAAKVNDYTKLKRCLYRSSS